MDVRSLIDEYAAYSLWANTLFVRRLDRGSPEVLDRATASSFPTLRQTMLHIRDADHLWHQRLRGEPFMWPAEEDTSLGTVLKHSARLRDLAASYNDDSMRRTVHYTDTLGIDRAESAWQIMLHTLNHGSYHRGQLVTMMRALGMDDIPNSDLLVYQRLLAK